MKLFILCFNWTTKSVEDIDLMGRAILIDGFIDEPACLGVPPFSSPQVRAVFGAGLDAGAEMDYFTIDQVRKGLKLPQAELSVMMAGAAVPGKYLRSLPASGNEVQRLAKQLPGIKLLGGPAIFDNRLASNYDFAALHDPAAATYDVLSGGTLKQRWRTLEEWNRWLLLGARAVREHPDYPLPLIAEIETYRGCPRFASGGCSFCVEPLKGKPVFREVDDIVGEVAALRELGVGNFRLGGQTDIISYMAGNEGISRPNPQAIERLFSRIASLEPEVLHVDNANPAVIADFPEESNLILRSLVKHCTSGNVLALGMESADMRVIEANNLNSSPDQVLAAIRMINEVGRERGENGMPRLLPGLNFIIGLDGESKRTLQLNFDFLKSVLEEGLLLRRINIRQVSPVRREFEGGVSHSDFIRFKEKVRKEIDAPMLRKLVPQGTILRGVFTEIRDGHLTFGRQIGTYPLLIGFPYHLPLGRFVDAAVVSWGQRSLTAIQYPLPVNSSPLRALEALPSVGRKRAIRLFRGRPLRSKADVEKAIQDNEVVESITPFLSFD